MATLAMLFLRRIAKVHIPTPPVCVLTHRCLRCFSQQEAQQCIALLADVSQPLMAGAGVFARNEPKVAADLLSTRKPIRRSDDQNVDQPADGSHSRMRHQPHHLGPFIGFLLDGSGQLRNLGIQLVQQLQ
jgi:hypothetical protein